MVLLKKKNSLLFLFLFINQIKFINSFEAPSDLSENSSTNSTDLISNSIDFEVSDNTWEIEEKYFI